MAMKPLSDEELAQTVELMAIHGTVTEAAKAAGMARTTFSDRVKTATLRGLMGFDPVMAGFEVSRASTNTKTGEAWVRQVREPGEVFEVPRGHRIKKVSALVDEGERVKQKWVMTGEDAGPDLEWLIERLSSAFEPIETSHVPATGPEDFDPDLLTLLPCNDWHINMLAWEREVGTNWDLKLAERHIADAVSKVLRRSAKAAKAIILGGGDLLHADNMEARTAQSGHALDVDGRYQKGVEVVQRLMVFTIDRALERNAEVLVRILRGNHDEHSSIAIAYFLKAWYRNDPRVVVDVDASLFFYHEFGRVMIGATHGHTVKLKDMPMIMATRQHEAWGRTLFRYVHGFHIHHKELHGWEEHGVVAEAHQAPIPQDAWHFGSGFLSGRSVQAITYHRRFGEDSRARAAIIDG
jgi:hypothetical protein